MKTIYLFILFISYSLVGIAQSFEDLTENESKAFEELSVNYSALYIKKKKGNDVYDVTVSLKNNGSDIISILPDIGEYYNINEYKLAKFNFTNANGSGMTARQTTLDPHEFKSNVSMKHKNCNYDPEDEDSEKELTKTKKMVIGLGIRSGQTISKTVRVRVAEGEKVKANVQLLTDI